MFDENTNRFGTLPANVGVGYKPIHFEDVQTDPSPVAWLEIHAENYMADGGPRLAEISELSKTFPISCHGVGLSIGSEGPLDADHLQRIKHLVGWLNPAMFSEHLAWSTHETSYLNDLLPVPYTSATAAKVISHIHQVQEVVGRPMLLENPSTYVAFTQSTMTEIEFLSEVVAATGCGLLLDVNNVFVSATNQNYDPAAYIRDFPVAHVGEIHLGGHAVDQDEHGAPLLIDSHGTEVVDPVWALYQQLLERTGPLPTLIEWDNDVPDWPVLAKEASRAENILVASQRIGQ